MADSMFGGRSLAVLSHSSSPPLRTRTRPVLIPAETCHPRDMDENPRFFDLVGNVRAMRRLLTDPVPDELLFKVLNAGVQAPSGMNSQPWSFLVLRKPEDKRWFADRYKAAIELREGFEARDALADEILAFAREHLAGYKVPRSIDFEEALPRHPSGKLYIRRLRDRYWAEKGRNI